MANSIDQTTKVNLGILGTLLASAIGGAAYLSSMKTSVDGMSKAIDKNTAAVERNTQQIQSDSRTVAVLEAKLAALRKDVEDLKSR